jgi:hypothetical protein
MKAGRRLAFGVLMAIACIAQSRAGSAAADRRLTWLIFLDDLHLAFQNTGHIRMLLRSIASGLIRDGDAFALRSPGPSPSLQLTTNRSLLDSTIGQVYGNALLPATIVQWWPGDQISAEVRPRASVAWSAATDMLNAGSSLFGGRRAMLYISDGYLDPHDERIVGFANAAQRSNITVFAMNASGLPDAQALPVRADAAVWAIYRADMSNSLRAISEPTGGFAVLDQSDFADALERITRRVR